MKILVTGAAGLIGSHTTDLLIEAGHMVDGIDDLSYGTLNNLSDAIKNKNFKFIHDKVENIDKYKTKYDVIYHFASLKKAWDGSVLSADILDTNYHMTKILVQRCLQHKTKFIFASTSDIYGNSKTFCEDDNITMGAPTNVRYSYALSKWYSEQHILNTFQQQGLECTVIRIFGCASKRSSTTWSGGHIPLFAKLSSQGKDIVIHGDGLQTRSISHANDIASGFVSILNNQQTTNGEIINLGTDEQTTVKFTAEYINNYFKNQSDIIFVPAEKIFGNYQEILVRFANITKAEKLLDYKIRKNTNEVIQEICLNIQNKK
jgi:UDP-glucose 4-epimerase|tara:strand:+ start:19827 stop:20780 length:954 start_codon:yes stop_codon:yes gene_type:complete